MSSRSLDEQGTDKKNAHARTITAFIACKVRMGAQFHHKKQKIFSCCFSIL